MKSSFLRATWLFISLGCICGMCSKNDAAPDGNNNNPVLAGDSTWAYFDDCPSLVYFYADNKRTQFQKWVATKIYHGTWGYSGNNPSFLVWYFENTGDTRFLQNSGNPSGKELFTIALKNMNRTPGPGSFQMDVDYKEGFCWYEVYNASGMKHDSTRIQGISNSTFNITSITYDKMITPTTDQYKMSGNAIFNIMYWPSGTGSTTDVHSLTCTFNNVPVDVTK
ncbi:MAG: hypothetical protein Q8891_10555 [Bacteroidota bacterium]|nr:hypothetical protein [Bacteroidota bacterium]